MADFKTVCDRCGFDILFSKAMIERPDRENYIVCPECYEPGREDDYDYTYTQVDYTTPPEEYVRDPDYTGED